MHWLISADTVLFRFLNLRLSNPFFDWLMPVLSNSRLLLPILLLAVAALLVRFGLRGRACVLFLALGLIVGDSLLAGTLKRSIARPRPFHDLPEARVLGGRTGSGSMPSSHALNCFAAAAIAGCFFRGSRRWLFPIAAAIAFSRIYTGMHYPSDVLVGAGLGMLVGAGLVHGVDRLWARAGPRWFPLWHRALPSILALPTSRDSACAPAPGPALDPHAPAPVSSSCPAPPSDAPSTPPPVSEVNLQWLHMGYVLLAFLLAARLVYILVGRFELSEDEAYQWLWSKHLALSYYSKPPLIAYTQWLGTRLWGDTELGVRFFSPVIATLLGLLTLRFFHRHADARAGFCMLLVLATTPLLAVGATLLTVDPLSVLFWTASMLAGWRALQSNKTVDWLWAGLWTGLGFLSKYTALFQVLSWALFFLLWRPARPALRRPGPYVVLGCLAVATLPVLLWNLQHGWITLTHLAERGGLATTWRFRPGLILEFTLSEFGLLNPVWFVAMLLAAGAAWKLRRSQPLLLFLLCMGAPLFLFYWCYTLRTRVLPNWIAPAVLPLFLLMGLYWHQRWRQDARGLSRWFVTGLSLGLVAVVVGHETRLISKVTGQPLPSKQDPLRRVRGWKETAQVVAAVKAQLETEGRPVFLIGAHYGITSQLAFYLPEAKAAVQRGDQPVAYYQSSDRPHNQFFFWPGYGHRIGENALYVVDRSQAGPPPGRLLDEFESVTDLGLHEVLWKGRVLRHLQLFACRRLRQPSPLPNPQS